VTDPYVPDRGDAIWVDLDPTVGHEQGGRRPAIVLSPARANDISDLAIVCPITNRIKNYPFEVLLPVGLLVSGAILANQVKTIDWRARGVVFITTLPDIITNRVAARIGKLMRITS
jgi:mRNA interferase MazF